MVNPWTIQDGPYWRSRAETLRRMTDETETFRPETRARMLRMARDFDAFAKRAEEHGATSRPSIDGMREASQSIRRGRGRSSRAATG